MPRRNNRATPPESRHHLDRWMVFCRETIAAHSDTNKKRDLPAHLEGIKKGQGQRIINNRKKGGETYAET